MSIKQRIIFSTIIGIPSIIGLFYFAGWKIALCILLIMWADNFNNKRYSNSENYYYTGNKQTAKKFIDRVLRESYDK